MQQQLDVLQQKLATVEKLETLFKSAPEAFEENLTRFHQYLKQPNVVKLNPAFDNFLFSANDTRMQFIKNGFRKFDVNSHNIGAGTQFLTLVMKKTQEHMQRVANTGNHSTILSNLYQLTNDIINVENVEDHADILLAMRGLIALQKNVIQQEIADTQNKSAKTMTKLFSTNKYTKRAKNHLDFKRVIKNIEIKKNSATTFTQNAVKYGVPIVGLTTGISLTTVSALMSFSPKFAMLVGMHVPPVALAIGAAVGALMSAYVVYHAIRAYYPAQPTEENPVADDTPANTPYSKPLTAAIMIPGLISTGFAALMQFSPKFAVLVGVHLSPAALISLATMGTALMAYGVYRTYQAYKQINPEVVVTPTEVPVSDVQPTTLYMPTSITKYLSYCFKFGGAQSPAPVTSDASKDNAAAPVAPCQ